MRGSLELVKHGVPAMWGSFGFVKHGVPATRCSFDFVKHGVPATRGSCECVKHVGCTAGTCGTTAGPPSTVEKTRFARVGADPSSTLCTRRRRNRPKSINLSFALVLEKSVQISWSSRNAGFVRARKTRCSRNVGFIWPRQTRCSRNAVFIWPRKTRRSRNAGFVWVRVGADPSSTLCTRRRRKMPKSVNLSFALVLEKSAFIYLYKNTLSLFI